MWQDPIVAEVRQVREAHIQHYQGDLRAIYLDLKEQEQRNPSPKVSFPPKVVTPTSPSTKQAQPVVKA